MLMSRNRKFIFIHIYKNAGSSVTNALPPFAISKWQRMTDRVLKKLELPQQFNPQPFPGHTKASELINSMGKEAFDSFFSFVFVRNPWDWQVSLYSYALKSTTHYQHDLIKGFGNFDTYIRWRCAKEARLQKDFIYSADGELLMDFVGRFKKINAEFATICPRIRISTSLPRVNVSNEAPSQQYYTEETRELVRQTFEAGIAFFGYEFG